MRRNTILATVLAMTMTALVGCGGGSEPEDTSGDPLSRTMIAGDGEGVGGARLTSKKWKTISMRSNDKYNGTGADQPCPTEIALKTDGGATISCNSQNYIELRSDGKAREFSVERGGLDELYDDIWTFEGTALGHVVNIDGTRESVYSYNLTNEGIVGGKQRFRMKVLSAEVGGDRQPEDIGLEFVIEDTL